MPAMELLERLEARGVSVMVDREDLVLRPASNVPSGLLAQVKEHKAEILSKLQCRTELIDLPWPIGYGGLPLAQVEMVEAVMDKWGVTDPILRKYNVLAWVRGYFQDREENHGPFYSAICAEQNRLGGILRRDRQC